MRKYIIKRILISIVILFLVAFVIYALMRCLPTSYVEAMARQKSMQPNSKSFEEWMEQLTRMYNLDVGIVPGFFKWLGQMLTFNFGDSWLWTKPVTEVFNSCVWFSFFMGLIAFVLDTAGGVITAKILNLFLPKDKKVNPMVGAAAMSLSRFCVVTNALRLNLFKN